LTTLDQRRALALRIAKTIQRDPASIVASLRSRLDTFKYDEHQKRDDHGRWTDEHGVSRKISELSADTLRTVGKLAGAKMGEKVPKNNRGERILKTNDGKLQDLVDDGLKPGDKYIETSGPHHAERKTYTGDGSGGGGLGKFIKKAIGKQSEQEEYDKLENKLATTGHLRGKEAERHGALRKKLHGESPVSHDEFDDGPTRADNEARQRQLERQFEGDEGLSGAEHDELKGLQSLAKDVSDSDVAEFKRLDDKLDNSYLTETESARHDELRRKVQGHAAGRRAELDSIAENRGYLTEAENNEYNALDGGDHISDEYHLRSVDLSDNESSLLHDAIAQGAENSHGSDEADAAYDAFADQWSDSYASEDFRFYPEDYSRMIMSLNEYRQGNADELDASDVTRINALIAKLRTARDKDPGDAF